MLYLVRHGLAAAGLEDLDPGLDALGHRQAEAAANALAPTSAGRLVVSPLRRTRETADPIARLLSLPPEIRHEVAEVFDPTVPPEERQAMIGPFMAGNWSEQPEPLRAWRARVVETLLEFARAAQASGKPTIIVSHYIAIGVAIGHATGDDRVVPVQIANCSITSLGFEAGALTLKDAASRTHLAEDLVTGLRTALPGGSTP